MSDLIDRQEVLKLFPLYDYKHACFDLCNAIKDMPSAQPLTEEDFIELRDRFGDEVEAVVCDMVSGEGKRWMT